ncbi:hypothetical protein [Streptomyces carpinensis]|uniref:Uncharacterized protein n=1 Tax=Streptomyces carpinensis TaxID=66369 RepID=A0ABV1W137_9ACTN|nr:hypothetical protein [Streptomyces carpinensis]
MDQEAGGRGHTLPGGIIRSDDGDATPGVLACETVGEIRLDREVGRLLAVDEVHGAGRPPLVAYPYNGGVVGDSDVAATHLLENGHRPGWLAGRACSLGGSVSDSHLSVDPEVAHTSETFTPGRSKFGLAVITTGWAFRRKP